MLLRGWHGHDNRGHDKHGNDANEASPGFIRDASDNSSDDTSKKPNDNFNEKANANASDWTSGRVEETWTARGPALSIRLNNDLFVVHPISLILYPGSRIGTLARLLYGRGRFKFAKSGRLLYTWVRRRLGIRTRSALRTETRYGIWTPSRRPYGRDGPESPERGFGVPVTLRGLRPDKTNTPSSPIPLATDAPIHTQTHAVDLLSRLELHGHASRHRLERSVGEGVEVGRRLE